MKKLLSGALLVVAAIAMVVVVRALLHAPEKQAAVARVSVEVDEAALARHLREAIRFRTVSNENPADFEASEFEGFIAWVRQTYPDVAAAMDLTLAGSYSMLYRWQGSDPALAPVLVTGHYDVVPVIPGTEALWSHPPFDGAIVDGVIWGRGSLDDKSAVVAQLEAATVLLRAGFRPRRTLYLSFGHDEEVGGPKGAAAVVALLRERGVRLAWTLDEGSFLFRGLFPGVEPLMASINVAEKGFLTLRIVATGDGGHSSVPPRRTAVGELAAAITALEDHPVPGGLSGLSAEMFDAVSRHMGFGYRLLFANRWLLGPVLEDQLSRQSFGNAMLRTTAAPTMLSGSVKENVLPIEAIATVNFRLHPRDSVDAVVAHVKSVVENEHVSVRMDERGGVGASRVSDWHAEGYAAIERALREIHGDLVVMPGLMVAGSDTRHYGQIADNSYRFNPMTVTPEDLTGFHGTNEKLAVENLCNGVRTYVQIFRHALE